jgi:four helix bundle protein
MSSSSGSSSGSSLGSGSSFGVNVKLSHEKLDVYNRSLDFIEFSENVLKKLNSESYLYSQLERSSSSITLNIAEGTGKFTPKDKNRYYDIARGSAVESAACLDILFKKNKITLEENQKGKMILTEIVSMLIGLIKSNSNRIYEDSDSYGFDYSS